MVITHSNGVQTYYGHCSALYYQAGATVSQGQKDSNSRFNRKFNRSTSSF